MNKVLLLLACINAFTGLLMLGLSVPLILGKVPRNTIYGVRTPTSLASDEQWYRINVYGGRVLAWWSVPIILTGVAGWMLSPAYFIVYASVSAAVTLLSVAGACIQIILWCRKPSA